MHLPLYSSGAAVVSAAAGGEAEEREGGKGCHFTGVCD